MALLALDGSTLTEQEPDGRTIDYQLRNAADTADIEPPANSWAADSGSVLFLAAVNTANTRATIRAFNSVPDEGKLLFIGSTAIMVPSGVDGIGRGLFVPTGHGITTAAQVRNITCVVPVWDTNGWGLGNVVNGTLQSTIQRVTRLTAAQYEGATIPMMSQHGSYMVVGGQQGGSRGTTWYACDEDGADVPQLLRNEWTAPNAYDRIAQTATHFYGVPRPTEITSPRAANGYFGLTQAGVLLACVRRVGNTTEYGVISANTWTKVGEIPSNNSYLGWSNTGVIGYLSIRQSGAYSTVSGTTFQDVGTLSGGTRNDFWNSIFKVGDSYAAGRWGGSYGTASGDTYTEVGQLAGVGWFFTHNGSTYAAYNSRDGRYGTVSGSTFTQLGQVTGLQGLAWNGTTWVGLTTEGSPPEDSYGPLGWQRIPWVLSFGR